MKLRQRLADLERTVTARADPVRVFTWCCSNSIEVPEPQPGEAIEQWLRRVPTDALTRIVESADR